MNIKIVMDEISEKYRDNIKELTRISKLIIEINTRVQKDKNMLHNDFVRLVNQVEELVRERSRIIDYNEGLYDAREIVMKYIE